MLQVSLWGPQGLALRSTFRERLPRPHDNKLPFDFGLQPQNCSGNPARQRAIQEHLLFGNRGICPVTTRTFRGAATHMASMETRLTAMANTKAEVYTPVIPVYCVKAGSCTASILCCTLQTILGAYTVRIQMVTSTT